MSDIVAICLVVSALFAYVNHRWIHLPMTIGVMALALAASLLVVSLNAMGFARGAFEFERALIGSIDFSDVLMRGMLSFLLFAGALHVDLSRLRAYRWQVGVLAVGATVASTAAVGFGSWLLLPMFGLDLGLVYCLLFGALISPTDPIAVMGILKSAGAPEELELVIAGESLFNDGVGVVLFALLFGMLTAGEAPTVSAAATLFAREAVGGVMFGFVLGYVTYRLLRSIDQYQVEVLLTLAAVTGGYAAASHLHVSGPLAMVVCGLIVGNRGRALGMSDTTRRYIDMFWELIDELLNALLFVLIGFEVLLVDLSKNLLAAGFAMIVLVLAARLASVGAPLLAAGRWFGLPDGSAKVLVWGGLRGGISVALALSLPPGEARDTVLGLTYCVVVFSILVQGLTIRQVVRSTISCGPERRAH